MISKEKKKFLDESIQDITTNTRKKTRPATTTPTQEFQSPEIIAAIPEQQEKLTAGGMVQGNTEHITEYNKTQNVIPVIEKEYSHHSFSELCKTPAPIKYWVKGYIQEQALHMIFGEPACGKSFVAIDVGASIGCTEISEWHGIKLKHGPVIYLAGEGAAGLRKRCAGWANQRGVNPENVRLEIFDEVFHLDDPENTEYSIDNTIKNIRAVYDKPALIIIDTLHVFMSGDENKASDVADILTSCRKLIRELECAVMIIHHVGVNNDAKGRGRGSSSLKGAMDIEMKITKSDEISNIITIEQTKNKEDKLQQRKSFKLIQNNIPGWFDEDGFPVTTCTIEYDAQATIEAIKNPSGKKAGEDEKRAIKSFRNAVEQYGIIIHDEQSGQDYAAVKTDDWKTAFSELSSAEKKTLNTQFYRARKILFENEDTQKLTKREIDGQEYYCAPLKNNWDLVFVDDFTKDIQAAIEKRRGLGGNNGTTGGGEITIAF